MRNKSLVLAIALVLIVTLISAMNEKKPATEGMTPEVKALVDKTCFGCHNVNSRNQEAKDKLNFSTFDELSKMQKIGKLKDISKAVKEGEMPPKKFLERNPDKKLTDAEVKLLTDWVKTETKALKKN